MGSLISSRDAFSASLRAHLHQLASSDMECAPPGDQTHGLDDAHILDVCSREISAHDARQTFAALPRGHFGRQLLLSNPSVALYADRTLDEHFTIGVRDAIFITSDDLETFARHVATAAELRSMLYNARELEWSWNLAARELQKDNGLQGLDAAEWFMFKAEGISNREQLAKIFNENDLIDVSESVEPTEENAKRICRLVELCPQHIHLHPRRLDATKRWIDAGGIETEGRPPKLRARGELRRLIAIGCMNGVVVHPYIRMLNDADALANEDVAVRCAAYSWGTIEPDDFYALAERDGTLFFVYAMMNPKLKKNADAWSKLRDVYVSRGSHTRSQQ